LALLIILQGLRTVRKIHLIAQTGDYSYAAETSVLKDLKITQMHHPSFFRSTKLLDLRRCHFFTLSLTVLLAVMYAQARRMYGLAVSILALLEIQCIKLGGCAFPRAKHRASYQHVNSTIQKLDLSLADSCIDLICHPIIRTNTTAKISKMIHNFECLSLDCNCWRFRSRMNSHLTVEQIEETLEADSEIVTHVPTSNLVDKKTVFVSPLATDRPGLGLCECRADTLQYSLMDRGDTQTVALSDWNAKFHSLIELALFSNPNLHVINNSMSDASWIIRNGVSYKEKILYQHSFSPPDYCLVNGRKDKDVLERRLVNSTRPRCSAYTWYTVDLNTNLKDLAAIIGSR
ncbi:hypothetical protein CSKR_110275, partial [Clonorchis sinensis]